MGIFQCLVSFQGGVLHLQDDKKIKEVGEEIADAASDNEPWFEPEQFMEMFPGEKESNQQRADLLSRV